ncbi:hypothetical protein BD560DRAFT_428263 [Blakeslea trispora]|nr:hypothetical protein BD560DRAFT_428263 [Blakeslea trispora]
MAYHLECSYSVLVSPLNVCFMKKPNEFLKHAKFTSDLLKINPINNKMKLRGKVITLWMIKGSLESIMFIERHSNSPSSQIPNLEYLKFFVYTIDMPSLKIDFQCLKLALLENDNETFHPYLVMEETKKSFRTRMGLLKKNQMSFIAMEYLDDQGIYFNIEDTEHYIIDHVSDIQSTQLSGHS